MGDTQTHLAIDASLHRRFEEEALPALERYTTIPCLSPAFDAEWERTGHLAEAAELLSAWGAERRVEGLSVHVEGGPGRTPIVLADAPATKGASGTVLLYGHLDKQPPLGAWRDGLDPFTPVREGDRLYGRGTADDGYAFFAALSALEMLDAAGTPRPRVVVLVEASEESGSPDLPAHLDSLAGRLGRPDLVVCLDSGCLTYDRLWLTTSLRGNLVAAVTVEVLTEGVHSGSAGGVVPTSFRLLRRLLDRVEDPATGEVRLPQLRAAVPDGAVRSVGAAWGAGGAGGAGGAWRAAEVYPIVPGLQLAGSSEEDRLVRRAWLPSLTVTGIDGVPSVRDGGNVLRPSTSAKLSLRLPPSVDARAGAAALERVLTTDPPEGARVTVEMETPASGWAAPTFDSWVADPFTRASVEIFGNPPGSLGEGGTIPFLAMLGERYPGVPLVATGVLGPGSNAHGPNEFLHVPMAEAVATATARLVEATATRPRTSG